MKLPKILFAGLVCAAPLAASAANVGIGLSVGVPVHEAPPAAQFETIGPVPGPGYVWVGGHWAWHHRWVWVRGHWSYRPGYAWAPGRWDSREGGYVWVEGQWVGGAPGVGAPPPPPAAPMTLPPVPPPSAPGQVATPTVPMGNAGAPAVAAPSSPAPYVPPPEYPPSTAVEVGVAPPPPIVETYGPPPGPEFVWVAGHWGWSGRWIWIHGNYARHPRWHRGGGWVAGRWENRRGRYVWVEGRWR